jgi:hypothetical protein
MSFTLSSVSLTSTVYTLDKFKKNHVLSTEFPIKIRSLTGKETDIFVDHKTTVYKLKHIISIEEQISFDQQRLVYNGKQLEDDRTLDYYNIIKDTVVHIILRIRGGMFHETSARKDYGSIQWAFYTPIEEIIKSSIEEVEEKLRKLKN